MTFHSFSFAQNDSISPWTFGAALQYQHSALTGVIASHISSMNGYGANYWLGYKKMLLEFSGNTIFSKTLDSIPFDQVFWKNNAAVRGGYFNIGLGYPLYSSSKIRIIPSINYAEMRFYPSKKETKENPQYDDIFFRSPHINVNLAVEFKIRNYKKTPERKHIGFQHDYIKLKYSFCATNFKNIDNRFDGSIHSLSLGFGFFGKGNPNRVENWGP